MSLVSGVGRAGPSGRAPATRSNAGFRLPEAAAAAPPTPASPVAALSGLLAMQEAQGDTALDREGARHGRALLAVLAELQRACLEGQPDGALLRRLADLAAHIPEVATPALQAALRAVQLRAAVELARREGL